MKHYVECRVDQEFSYFSRNFPMFSFTLEIKYKATTYILMIKNREFNLIKLIEWHR